MTKSEKNTLLLTAMVGLFAAVCVGIGEFLLHYDPLARFSEVNYDFMNAASDDRQTLGHFFGVLAAPLYLVGCWHIYMMLKPAGQKLAFGGFLAICYGFIVGAVWIGSRASIGALTHVQESSSDLHGLVELYQYRYESLLWVIRIATLVLSLIFIGLTMTGRSHYPRWMAVFNPIVLLLMNFLVYVLSPELGKYLMPIALNVGFGLFFLLSLVHATRIQILETS